MIPLEHGPPLHAHVNGLLQVTDLWRSHSGKSLCGPYGDLWMFVWPGKQSSWTLALGPPTEAKPVCRLYAGRRAHDEEEILLGHLGKTQVLVLWNPRPRGPAAWLYQAQTLPWPVRREP